MSAGDEHERFEDAVGAYLLHALPDDEAAAFEAHLAGCAACRGEVERLRVAADALPGSPHQFAAPPELKERIMAIVTAEAELLHAAGARADEPAGPPPRRGRLAVLRPGWWSVRPGLALAGAAVVLALGVLGGLIAGSALNGGGGTRTVVAAKAPPGAKIRLIVRQGGHSTLVGRRMPPPGRGRVYQVWLQSGTAEPRPTNALFGVRPDGSATVDVPSSLRHVDAVLVTSEPDGGSPAPTRPAVVEVRPS